VHRTRAVGKPRGPATALLGGATIGAGYALARRAGLSTTDLAARVARGRPGVGRLVQIAAGTAACLPATRTSTRLRGALAAAAVGLIPPLARRAGRRETAVSVGVHALGGAIAGGRRRR
jgi:hypothetical protein